MRGATISIKSGTCDSGNEISDEQIAPIALLARGIVSRKLQSSLDCCCDCAITLSKTKSEACSNNISKACSGSFPPERPRSSNTDHSGGSDHGCRSCGKPSDKNLKLCADMSSNAEMPSPTTSLVRFNNLSAACGLCTVKRAVPSNLGCDTSLRLAAVIIPSVPSEPISKCRKS